jgi:hypothetical protein
MDERMTMTQAAPAGKSITSLLAVRPAGPARRLSESGLWDRQRRFYQRGADTLWGTAMVPHGITGNPRIAATYARLLVEFLRSVPAGPAAGDGPHIVEFGGGSGRFAFLLVRALCALAPGLRFTYVVTDFSADRVAAWAAHPSYQPLVDQGLIDFAVLDADRPGPLELVVSGRTVGAGSLDSPVVGIANYVFDTLRHDSYAVCGGELRECRVLLPEDPGKGPDTLDSAAIDDLSWDTAPCGTLPPELTGILHHYRDTLDDTAVLVPVGGIRCLDFVAGLTSAATCMLVADKGHCTPVELCSQPSPSVVRHGSGFSLMVNFDLLARYVREHGGVAVLPPEPARSLVVAAFVRGGRAGGLDDPARFESWVQDQLVDTGPDNYFTLRPLLSGRPEPAIETMLAGLQLSRCEPSLLIELLPRLLDVLPTVPDSMRGEVERALMRVWDNWFPIGEPIDLALCLGLAFSAMDRFARAVDFLERSVKEQPDSAPAAFAMGVARRGLRDLRVALEWAERAIQLEPGFSQARALRAVLVEELDAERGR